jgi:transcriptional regulator with XRE-family HTH domain
MSNRKSNADWQSLIQNAIEKSGLTLLEIARRTGVSQSQLSRFTRGERNLTLPTAEKIGKLLGLELKEKGGK